MTSLYVIGHVNPDTDSIAAAVGYAWLLRERDGEDAIAARAGPLNLQSQWVLKRLNLEAPQLLTDASPRFVSITRRLDTAAPESPLREAWPILNRAGGVAPIVKPQDGKPLGLITGWSLFDYLAKSIGPRPRLQEISLAEMFELPCHQVCDTSVPRFQSATRIRDALQRVLREEHNEFLIVDEHGTYMGVCRQRDVLDPPRLRMILVDHNEPSQALASLDEAELIEVLDHHRLGNMSTHIPIRFSVDVVGSTSTLVSERIEECGLSAPAPIAGLLLAGLLSDTLILTSPTTIERDHRAAERLARWAFVPHEPLANENLESFGKQVLAASAGLATRQAQEIITTDMKVYQAGNYQFAISQAELTDLMELDEHLSNLRLALDEFRQKRGLDFAMLMVTDVVNNASRLLLVNPPPILEEMPYLPQPDGTWLAEGVVSRKKQLLPVILGLLED